MRKKGRFIGSFAPYGYMKDKTDKTKLVADEYAAGVVKKVFNLKIKGYSNQKIADILNDEGELPPSEYKRRMGLPFISGFEKSDKILWTPNSILRILRNETYMGSMVQGKRLNPSYKSKKQVNLPKENWIVVESTHEPIIEKKDFLLVQNILEKDTRTAPKHEKVYFLSGLITCGDCGFNMIRKSMNKKGKKYSYYICSNYKENKSCTSHSINCEFLEEGIKTGLGLLLDVFQEQENIILNNDQEHNKLDSLNERLKAAEFELERIKTLNLSIDEHYQEGVLEQDEYLEYKRLYSSQIKKSNHLINRITEQINKQDFEKTRDVEFRELALTYINKINIHHNKRIELMLIPNCNR